MIHIASYGYTLFCLIVVCFCLVVSCFWFCFVVTDVAPMIKDDIGGDDDDDDDILGSTLIQKK